MSERIELGLKSSEVDELLQENVVADEQFETELEMVIEKSIIKFDKRTQIKQSVNRGAIELAKEKGDPLYKKYKKFIDLKNDFETAIVKKYRNKSLQAIRAKTTRRG